MILSLNIGHCTLLRVALADEHDSVNPYLWSLPPLKMSPTISSFLILGAILLYIIYIMYTMYAMHSVTEGEPNQFLDYDVTLRTEM